MTEDNDCGMTVNMVAKGWVINPDGTKIEVEMRADRQVDAETAKLFQKNNEET